MTTESGNTPIATSPESFDFNQSFDSAESAQLAAGAAGLANFRISRVEDGHYIIIDLKPARTKPAETPAERPEGGPEGEGKPEGEKPAGKARKARQKAEPKAKPEGKAKPAKRGLAARQAKLAAELEKAKAKPEAKPEPPKTGKDMHYSGLKANMPTPEAIASGLKGMNPAQREHYQNAMKGTLPAYDVFPKAQRKDGLFDSADTHRPFWKLRDQLIAIRDMKDPAKALEAALAWRGGQGTRMTTSSTIPLGRWHQQLILALQFQVSAKDERKAKREASKAKRGNGNGAAEQAPPTE